MAEKKIQPKRPTSDEPAAGTRKAEKTSAKRVTQSACTPSGSTQSAFTPSGCTPRRSDLRPNSHPEARALGPGFVLCRGCWRVAHPPRRG